MTASESVEPAPASGVGRVALVGLFVTALVTAQLTASKLLAFSLPVSLPATGSRLVLPGAALAYAVTYFASDCYAELYGRRAAQTVVNVGFAMNFVVLGLVWTTIAAPAVNPEFAGEFRAVLAASSNVIAGSLLAYVVSQNWDVLVFHRIRDATDGDHLWLRNVGSTATSQLLDTVLFVGVAFAALPALGVNSQLGLPLTNAAGPSVLALVVGQYLLKVAIAVADTPFVYAAVGALRRSETPARPSSGD
ncbi:MAG: queuosine precursor transporter [Halolamina sp.]